METKGRIEELDTVRAWANVMIVLWHATAAAQYCAGGTAEAKAWFALEHFGVSVMPAFFFLSGFFMMSGWSMAAYPRKLASRVRRLAVPYVAWNALFTAFYLAAAPFVPRLAQRVESFRLDTVEGAFGKIAGLLTFPLDLPLWFVRTTLAYALLFPAIAFLVKAWKGIPAVAAVAGLLAVQSAAPGRWPIVEQALCGMVYPPETLVWFAAGAWCRLHRLDIVRLLGDWRSFAVAFGVFALRHAGLWPAFFGSGAIAGMLTVPIAFLPALAIHAAAGRSRWAEAVRRASFFIYAGHFLFCSMLLHSVAPRLGWMGAGKQTLLTLLFLAGIPLMTGVRALLARTVPRLLRIFDGTL